MRIGAAGVMARAFISASVAPGIGASSLATPSAASAAPPASAAAAQSATTLDQKTIPTPGANFRRSRSLRPDAHQKVVSQPIAAGRGLAGEAMVRAPPEDAAPNARR